LMMDKVRSTAMLEGSCVLSQNSRGYIRALAR
jgi:hypothetical protein